VGRILARALRDWEKANTTIRQWEDRGSKEEPEEEPKKGPTTIAEASEKFLEDARSRELAEATLYKYRLLFRQLLAFTAKEGLRYLTELDLEMLRKFRARWTEHNLTSRNKLERLPTFLRFCVDSEWITQNHALKLKAPKVTEPPTLPLNRDDVAAILAGCQDYPDKLNRVRLKALVLLLRFSGLRIRDAVTLSRDRISEDKLFLRTMKTGTVVWCPLPPVVIEALNTIPVAGKHFFWSGEGKAKSCASSY
jgi:site-specific recombinase XerC